MATGFIVTDKGIEKLNAAASESGKQVKIVRFKAGDGGDTGAEKIDGSLTDVVSEVYAKDFDANDYYSIDAEYPNRLLISAFLDEDVGDFTVNEIGYFDEDGDMIIYGLPKVEEHKVAGECVCYRNYAVFSNEQIENLEIIVDNINIEELKNEFQKKLDSLYCAEDSDIDAHFTLE